MWFKHASDWSRQNIRSRNIVSVLGFRSFTATRVLYILFYLEASILDLLKYPVTRSKSNSDAIEDIQDGLLYRTHFGSDSFFKGASDEKKKTEIHISFRINTDGVALFRSSKYSIWPVYLVVNELPPNCR